MAVKKPTKAAGPSSGDEAPKASFETKLSELEEIVRQLEEGEKPLDESLELYEKGVAALKVCHVILDRAEKRIRTLVQRPDGEAELRDVKEAEASEDDEGNAESEGKSRRRGADAAPKTQAAEGGKAEADRGSLFGGR